MLSLIPDTNTTYLAWLKEIPGKHSPDAFLNVVERLEYIRAIGLNLDFGGIHPNRIRQLSRTGSRYEPYAFRRFDDRRRHTMLAVFLNDLCQDITDQAFEIHDRQMMTLLSKGRKAHEELQKKNGRSVNEKVIQFATVGEALIEARNTGQNPFDLLEKVFSWSRLIEAVEEARKLSRPADFDYLDLLENRFSYLRKYTPTLLNSLEFKSSGSSDSLISAIQLLEASMLPDSAGFRKMLQSILSGTVGRSICSKQTGRLTGAITKWQRWRSFATLYVPAMCQSQEAGSTRDFDDYIIPAAEWEPVRECGSRLAVSHSVSEYLEERISTLSEKFQSVIRHAETLKGVSFADGRLVINRLERDVPDEARELSRKLYAMLPRVKLPEILMEVARWTGFDKEFTHVSTGKSPDPEEQGIVMATLMAMGTNIGLSKMADATKGITYRQMANSAQWRLHDDAMNRAQSYLVNYHHKSPLSGFWGDGTTSSSDGMRMQIAVSSLHADSNPHYGTGKGATIYRFTSDQFSSFYTKVINTNARDAVHIIDGLLHHETDLDIQEHYTDSAGYTDQVFGLTHMLGFRFAPRLRDISDSKLYAIGKISNSPKLSKLVRGSINTRLIEENYDDVLSLAHSIREGRVSGSLIMGKLGSYARQNKMAKALREMGRIENTIFIMNYISDEPMPPNSARTQQRRSDELAGQSYLLRQIR